MQNQYIMTLIETIKMVEITKNKQEQRQAYDFDGGIEQLVEVFSDAKKEKRQIFFVGNGGSAAIASHMTADYMKNGGMKTYGLYDNAVLTCLGNDYGYEYVFSKQLEFLLNKGDILVAVSSSGESKNIINAIQVAKRKEAEVVTFTGFDETNSVRNLGNYNVYVPIKKYGIVESIHNILLQQIVDIIMERDGVGI